MFIEILVCAISMELGLFLDICQSSVEVKCSVICMLLYIQGLGSDLYVVRGVGAGQERVTAHFVEPGFENLSHIITLTVAEAVSLDPPSPVFMIPGTRLQFTLRALRRNEVKGMWILKLAFGESFAILIPVFCPLV